MNSDTKMTYQMIVDNQSLLNLAVSFIKNKTKLSNTDLTTLNFKNYHIDELNINWKLIEDSIKSIYLNDNIEISYMSTIYGEIKITKHIYQHQYGISELIDASALFNAKAKYDFEIKSIVLIAKENV